MPYQPQSAGAFLKGLVASNQPLAQPKGSFPRGSNLVMIERGALTPCDGSGIINAVGGAVLANQGRFMSLFLYEPTGVNPYYLAIKEALNQPLGAPHLVSATASAGGSLISGQQYFYVITALDGAGGETVASNELSATPSGGNLSVTLVWNVVPNAIAYNVYRSTTSGTEVLQISSSLPVLQPNPLTATVTFIDTGVSTSSQTFNATAAGYTTAGLPYILFTLIGATLPSNAIVGVPVTSAAFSPSTFNGNWTIFSVPSPTSVIVQGGPGSGTATGALTTIGPNSPSSASGTGFWLNPTNILAHDNVYATASIGGKSAEATGYLQGTGYGFAIPGGATISGITVTAYVKASSPPNGSVLDSNVTLLKAGVLTGDNKANPNLWPTTPTSTPVVYGGPMDLWGTTWTPADINNSNFGIAMQAIIRPILGTEEAFVDYISITVSYLPSGGDGTLSITNSSSGSNPPSIDTTGQTALFQMPNVGPVPISYSNLNIVAYYPATLMALGQVPSGGSGGQGTTGPGINGLGSSTPSGGVTGLVGPLPQFKQFTNRAIIALGNGFAMQLFSDPTGSKVNPAFVGAITSVSVTADVVTVTTSATLTAFNLPPGSNVVISGATDATYDGTFPVISVNTGASTFTIRNTAASGGASTGTFTVSTTPIATSANTFTPSFPAWVASTAVAVGDIYVPKTQPGAADIYIIATQAGITGSVEPSWQTVAATGQQFPTGNIADGQGVIWQEAGYKSAPSPPGAGHIEVYAGSLWAFNTSPINTANGLDGPTALRMSNVNDPNGWNSVNQAFLDKDDGAEGMGMGKFTITAQGIPPEGSLIAFKYRVPYQIIGVFGANNFAIQPVSSDMGCLAPRTIQFVPGFGLMRYCHLGIGVFNGYKDEVISEQIRPYLFPVNDFDTQDITVVDANYVPLSWAAQTANPPMYAMAAPIGNSGGQLSRMFLFDLILKCWAANTDLPFPLGCIAQVQPVTSNPLTIIGGFGDGCLQRWQAGDVQWYTGGGGSAVAVAWSVRTITVASQTASQRVWARKLIVRGTNAGASGQITVQPRVSTVALSAVNYAIPATGDFDLFADVGQTGLRFDAIISGNLHVEIDGCDWAIEPRPFGVPVAAI